MTKNDELRKRAVELRGLGYTFNGILSMLQTKVPKATLSYWCRGVKLPPEYFARALEAQKAHLEDIRSKAVKARKKRGEQDARELHDANKHLSTIIKNTDAAKVALAMLYLGEGSKTKTYVSFCNSDPMVIQLFLKLFKQCYTIHPAQLRCTVHCRMDQDPEMLKDFWTNVTGIPCNQFYKPQIDKRTAGIPTRRASYKGVCRIDYLRSDVYKDLQMSISILLGH